MSGALREILASFGFSVDDKELKRGHEATEGFIGTLKGLGHVVAEAFVFHEVKEFVGSIVESGVALEHMSARTGMATDQLQAYEYAAKLAGVGADELDSSLSKLSRTYINAADKGGDGATAFRKLGIDAAAARKAGLGVGDMLPQIADGFVKLKTPAERNAVAMELFGRGGARLVPLLAKGSAGLREMTEEAKALGGGLSEDAIEKSVEMERATAKLDFAFTGLKGELASQILPALAELVTGAAHLVRDFRAWTTHTKTLQAAFFGLGGVGVLKLIGHLGGLRGALGLLTKGFFQVMVPLYALEDFMVFMAGGKSAMGVLLDKAFGKGTSSKVRASIESIIAKVEELLGKLGPVKTAAIAIGLAFGAEFVTGIAGAVKAIPPLTAVLGGLAVPLLAAGAAAAALLAVMDQIQKLKAESAASGGVWENIKTARKLRTAKPGEEGAISAPVSGDDYDKRYKLGKYAPAQEQNASLPDVKALASGAGASMSRVATTTIVHNNNAKPSVTVNVPPGTPRENARDVGDAAARGTTRALDLSATQVSLVPSAG